MKKGTLYSSGMQICVYSEHVAQTTGVGWRRDGHSIVSYPSMIPFRGGRKVYSVMSFSYTAAADSDTVYFAFAYPYTYTQLQQYIRGHLARPNIDTIMRRRRLCLTRAGNECDLLTITNFTDTKIAYVQTIPTEVGQSFITPISAGPSSVVWCLRPVCIPARLWAAG